MKSISRVVLTLALLLLPLALFGQFESAEVLGTVHDPSGAPIARVSVTLANQDTGIEAKTTTDEAGNYDFFNVKVGRYTITAEQTGFSKFTTTDVHADIGARQRVDIGLQVGAVTTSVEVTGAAAVLETDSSEHGQVVNTAAGRRVAPQRPQLRRSGAAFHQCRLNRQWRPSLLASGTPREAAFNVNGMRSTYNNFLLDGVDNNFYGTSNQGYSSQVVQPSPDSISEFKVITSNYSAEYGRVTARVIVTAVMKSGTNQFHGAAYEFLRNTSLNAVGFHIQPVRLPETDAAAQSVRRSGDRRTHYQEQTLLVWRLRRLPAVTALSQLRFPSPPPPTGAGILPSDRSGTPSRKRYIKPARRFRSRS